MSLETVRIDDLEELEKTRLDKSIDCIKNITNNLLFDHDNNQSRLQTANNSYPISGNEDLYENLMSGK